MLVERINHLQKRIKYGLKTAAAVALHEVGFADRVVAGDIVQSLGLTSGNRDKLLRAMRAKADEVDQILRQFPAYYTFVWQNVLRGKKKI